MLPEITTKHQRLIDYMDRNNFSGLILSSRANFSWLTAGKLNFVNGAAEGGVAVLAVTREKITCVTTNIEHPRIADEEFAGCGIQIVSHPWQMGAKRGEIFSQLFAGGVIGYDVVTGGLPQNAQPLAGDFAQVRWSLLPEEIERYRHAGRAASEAMEKTIFQIKPGITENQIAGLAANNIWSQSARPWVILIAADERIKKYRHPIPTDNPLKKIVEVVFCVEKFGLICSLTRFVSFGPIDSDLRKRHAAAVQIDAAVQLSSRPGQSLGQMFDLLCRQYETVGFKNEWQLHHQGGPTGYTTRDCIATPNDPVKLVLNQALAWNPSITGTKSEDTIIISDNEPIVVTVAGKNWPMVDVEFQGKHQPRPDILVVK